MDVIDAIHSRRSIRSFQPRLVEHSLIEAIIDDAAQAPPPTRDEVPWTFNVVQGVERIAGYGTLAKAYALQHRPAGPGWGWIDRRILRCFGTRPR